MAKLWHVQSHFDPFDNQRWCYTIHKDRRYIESHGGFLTDQEALTAGTERMKTLNCQEDPQATAGKVAKHAAGPWTRGAVRPIWGTLLIDSAGMRIDQTREANARLIAAAPDLLRAARAMVAFLSTVDNGKCLNSAAGWDLIAAVDRAEDQPDRT